MGDEKHYTIQIKGKAYRFRPLPTEDLERVIMIRNMNVSEMKTIKALTRVLATSAGPEQWDEITDRYVAKEVELTDFTVDVFQKLIKRQDKDAVSADDAE